MDSMTSAAKERYIGVSTDGFCVGLPVEVVRARSLAVFFYGGGIGSGSVSRSRRN